MSELQVWDEAQFLRRVRNKKERALRLIDSVLEQTPKDINQLMDAAHEKNFTVCAAIAHTLKGVAGNLSALQLEQCMRQIEHACNSEDATELSTQVHNADACYKILAEAFEQYKMS